ncbi:hypothetical protein BDN72DRAFT_483180 [Pluteus cervinus]|uniref:Uncharacterized protein n=1 Tax=Pluteus cervinus TaxID=181527 RepID=A0ACD3AZV5_9AGAR|nr:hypothetical protein BDN72DRAFT_483180 [Pluteus cervinus]
MLDIRLLGMHQEKCDQTLDEWMPYRAIRWTAEGLEHEYKTKLSWMVLFLFLVPSLPPVVLLLLSSPRVGWRT